MGGFRCGKSYVADHQRLSSLGYCFSALQPQILAASVIKAVEVLLVDLEENSMYAHDRLLGLSGIEVLGSSFSPLNIW